MASEKQRELRKWIGLLQSKNGRKKGLFWAYRNSLRKQEHQPVLLGDRAGTLQYKMTCVKRALEDHWNA